MVEVTWSCDLEKREILLRHQNECLPCAKQRPVRGCAHKRRNSPTKAVQPLRTISSAQSPLMTYYPSSECLLKYALLVLNIVLLILSVSVIGLSFATLQESGVISALIGTNLFAYGNGIIFIIACINLPQFVLAVTSLATDKFTFVLIYFAFAVTMGSLGVLAGAIGCYMDYQVKNSIEDWMRETLIAEYGHPYGEEITFAWDHLQSKERCCGMDEDDGDHIWANSTWFRKQTKYPKKRVPLSCCATCAVVRERYCSTPSSFASTAKPHSSSIACTEIGKICTNDKNSLASRDICVGGAAMWAVWPRHVFINTQGCFAPFKKQLELLGVRVSSVGCLFAAALFGCSFIAFRLLNVEHSRREYSLAIA